MEREAAYLAKLHTKTQGRLFSQMRFSPYGFKGSRNNKSKSVSYCCATPKLLVLAFPEAIAVVTLVRTRSPPYL